MIPILTNGIHGEGTIRLQAGMYSSASATEAANLTSFSMKQRHVPDRMATGLLTTTRSTLYGQEGFSLGYITGTSRMSLYCVLPWEDHAAPFTCAHDAMGLAQFKCILSPQLQRADPRLRWCQSRLMKGSYGSLLNSVFWRHASFGRGLVGSTGTLAFFGIVPFSYCYFFRWRHSSQTTEPRLRDSHGSSSCKSSGLYISSLGGVPIISFKQQSGYLWASSTFILPTTATGISFWCRQAFSHHHLADCVMPNLFGVYVPARILVHVDYSVSAASKRHSSSYGIALIRLLYGFGCQVLSLYLEAIAILYLCMDSIGVTIHLPYTSRVPVYSACCQVDHSKRSLDLNKVLCICLSLHVDYLVFGCFGRSMDVALSATCHVMGFEDCLPYDVYKGVLSRSRSNVYT
ncbi:predicted protein [Lichtheimia corymbifera JMRC:FSU:9682]|uniref:Uncharacterized protein n=1 Tax=Lichtheimia corymbifera JMRC:FSU:9682 TaxID=1263082 RepID=A0A068S6N4_9FUNG|nr:predicted protein [Lichtheimia corymbifera JMRC:FSU:9682]